MVNNMLYRFAPVLTMLGVVLIWQIICTVFSIPDFVLPSPLAILRGGEHISAIAWLQNIWATLEIVLLGYALALAVSLPLAVCLVNSPLLSRSVVPLLIIVQSTPIIAIAPIVVVTLGAGTFPRIVITFLITFFPLIVSTTTGLRATPPELIELSLSLKAPRYRQFLQIRLPYAVPYIFSAMKVSVTLAVIGAVIAEFVASDQGLGYMILNATSLFRLPQAFACLVVLVGLSLLCYQGVVLAERFLFPWSLPKERR
jgi:NitT/TauT family transport system permease protein